MSNKEKGFIKTIERDVFIVIKNIIPTFITVLIVCSLLFAGCTVKQSSNPFSSARLVNPGDTINYGSYVIFKIGEGVYKINDPGSPEAIKGGLIGTDIYMICGEQTALMIDLGNNYIDGYKGDLIAPREKAAEEFLNVVHGLIGKRPLEIALTHMHPDHDGMTKVFLDSDIPLWIGQGEDLKRLTTDHNIDPSIYKIFVHGEKKFDLGGGRIVETFLLRGHSNGGTVFLLKPDMMLFTGDAFAPGPASSRDLRTAEQVKMIAEDSQKLVDYILANFLPYDRYSLKVYTGHSGGTIYNKGKRPKVDAGYADWRFVQNMASCANGIVKGIWLVEGSGLTCVRQQPNSNSTPATGELATMVFGIGSIRIPVEVAYEAAGLKMPETEGLFH